MKEKIKQAINNWGVYGAFGLWLLYDYYQQDKTTQQCWGLFAVIFFGYYLLSKQIEAAQKYDCVFYKDIITIKDNDEWSPEPHLTQKISLPFPPYVQPPNSCPVLI